MYRIAHIAKNITKVSCFWYNGWLLFLKNATINYYEGNFTVS